MVKIMALNISYINPLDFKQIKINNQLYYVENFNKINVAIEPKFHNSMNVAFQVHVYLHYPNKVHNFSCFLSIDLTANEYLVLKQGIEKCMEKTYDYGIKGEVDLLNISYIGEKNKGNCIDIYFSINQNHDVIDLDLLFNNI